MQETVVKISYLPKKTEAGVYQTAQGSPVYLKLQRKTHGVFMKSECVFIQVTILFDYMKNKTQVGPNKY